MPPKQLAARHRDERRHARKAAALVPLALVSSSWATFLLGSTAAISDAAALHPGLVSPAATTIKEPASLQAVRQFAPGKARPAATARDGGIPSVALAAYQRAAAIIDDADATCHLGWPLLAAIGRVESDHGREAGSLLSADGVARPAILGPLLDGRNGTRQIVDTDGGHFDGNTRVDRAVGPMQFIPSTWMVVGVDADGDGRRNPQDIDDAALGAAVYLCSGSADLSTATGADSAVYRYNRSPAYVDLVTSIAKEYSSAGYAARLSSAYPPVLPYLAYGSPAIVKSHHQNSPHAPAGSDSAQAGAAPKSSPTHGHGSQSSPPSSDTATATPPRHENDPVAQVLTPVQSATAYCQTVLTEAQLGQLGGLDQCVAAFTTGGATAVTGLLTQPQDLLHSLLSTP
jgi:hypothetical protein